MATAAKKTSAKKANKTENEETEKFERSAFLDTAPATMINADGLLTAVPTIDTEVGKDSTPEAGIYSPRHHTAPKRVEFANEADYMLFKADDMELRANGLLERATSMREQADQYRKYGDPATRQKIKRAAKLREQLAALEKALAEEGIDD